MCTYHFVVAFGLIGRVSPATVQVEQVGLYAFATDTTRADELARECVQTMNDRRGLMLIPRVMVCGATQRASDVLDDATDLFCKLAQMMNAVAKSQKVA